MLTPGGPMLLLRDVQRGDLPALMGLARALNSVNLPADRRALAGIVDRSRESFACRIRNPLRRSYVFVLEDPARRRVLGSSMVIAQHGTRESPCTFFDVAEREHYSSTLDRHFRHLVLSLGFHFDGPTEIGGLVVDPGARRGESRAGKQLSYVRFLYMAMHPERFRETVLAELMPPLSRGGKSPFWESCGRRFTGLDYQDADKMSRRNKEFIQQLFPATDLYATLLPARVRALLGAVGPSTEPARRLLERIGFRYVRRIDPFDGGPHYEARLADVSVVRGHRTARVIGHLPPPGSEPWLVGAAHPGRRIRFRAVCSPAGLDGDEVALPWEARRLLAVKEGERVHLVPFR